MIVTKRIKYLDGLRGLGAVQVLFLHIRDILFPSALTSTGATDAFQKFIMFTPLSFFYNGHLAVFIFFLISGFILSNVYVNKNSLLSDIISRYIRLFIPCLFSAILMIILSFSFKKFIGCDPHYCTLNIISIQNIIKDMTFNVMLTGYKDASLPFMLHMPENLVPSQLGVNPVLWTISIEFYGSILIMILCKLQVKFSLKTSMISAGVASLFLYRTYYMCFILSFFINKINIPECKKINSKLFMYLIMTAGLLLMILSNYFPLPLFNEIASFKFGLKAQSSFSIQVMLSSFFIFIAIVRIGDIKKILENNFFQFLGVYSFPLYLSHYPILKTVCFFIANYNVLENNKLLFTSCSALLSISLSFFVASFFIPIDKISIKLSRWINDKKSDIFNLLYHR